MALVGIPVLPLPSSATGIRTEVLPGNALQLTLESAHGTWWFGTNNSTHVPFVSRNGYYQTLGQGLGDVSSANFGTAVGVDWSTGNPCAWNLKSGRQVMLGANGVARSVSATTIGGSSNSVGMVWSIQSYAPTVLKTPSAGISATTGVTNTSAVGAYRPNEFQGLYWPSFESDPIVMTPSGFAGSYLYGLSAAQQVGRAWVYNKSTRIDHPGLWTGSATSFVDLLPIGADSGSATKTLNGWQAGYVVKAGSRTDGIWHGTADSFVDVSTLVPPGTSPRSGVVAALTTINGHTVAYGYYPGTSLFVRWWLD